MLCLLIDKWGIFIFSKNVFLMYANEINLVFFAIINKGPINLKF